jgi:UDP-N-acetylglucosamine 1-carboxyvinyltransferase
MGAKISGLGTRTLTVDGVKALKGADYSVMSDRIEAGSYAIAAAMTRGALELIR